MWSSWSRYMPSWQQIHPKLCDPPGQGTRLHDIKTRCAQHYLLRTVCDPPGQGTHAFMTTKLDELNIIYWEQYVILLVKVHAFMTTKLDELNIIYWEQYVILLVKAHAFMTTKLDELNIIYWEQYVILLVKAHAFMTTKLDWRHVPWPGGSHTVLSK